MREELPLVCPTIFDGYPVRSVMTTRHGGVSPQPFGMNLSFRVGDKEEYVEQNRRLLFRKLGASPERIAFGAQCHSTTIQEVRRGGIYEACDGFITCEPHLWLAVSVADCVPIFLYDTRQHIAAAIHAGWRGTKEGIVAKTVDRMKRAKHSMPEDILAFIGPSAGACCYEVGNDVAAFFSNGFLKTRNGRQFLDLKSANQEQLTKASVPARNIEVSADCTICNPDRYHSYRRDRGRSGRMMALIALDERKVA